MLARKHEEEYKPQMPSRLRLQYKPLEPKLPCPISAPHMRWFFVGRTVIGGVGGGHGSGVIHDAQGGWSRYYVCVDVFKQQWQKKKQERRNMKGGHGKYREYLFANSITTVRNTNRRKTKEQKNETNGKKNHKKRKNCLGRIKCGTR